MIRMNRSFTSIRLVVGILVAWGVGILSAAAQDARDNPFGMPEPDDPARAGTVILHGGGLNNRRPFREAFMKAAQAAAAGRDAKTVLLMPSDQIVRGHDDGHLLEDGESREAYEQRLSLVKNYGLWKSAAKSQGLPFQFVYQDKISDPGDQRIIEQIRNAAAIWFTAYEPTWLPRLFEATNKAEPPPVVVELRKLLKRGGVIGSLGGATACLPQVIIADDVGNGDDGWILPDVQEGLGLLDKVVVEKDFDFRPGRLERFMYLLQKGDGETLPQLQPSTIGIAICHNTAAILHGKTISAIGDESVNVFVASNEGRTLTWHRLKNDQTLTLGTVAQPQSVREATNPFGLPTRGDQVATGWVVLHGGEDTSDMYDLIAKLGQTPVLMHCPMASDSYRPLDQDHDKRMAAFLEKEFDVWTNLVSQGKAKSVRFLTTRRKSEARSSQFAEPLRKANAVWFSGGDQSRLSDFFVSENPLKPTPFQIELKQVVQRGGVVGGTSAGLAIMPLNVILPDEDDREAAQLTAGFGVLERVLAEQHFDARHGRIKRLTDLLWDGFEDRSAKKAGKHEIIGLAVEEATSATIHIDQLEVRGEQQVHLLLRSKDEDDVPPSITWHTLRAGDIGTVKKLSNDGYALELTKAGGR